MNSHMYQQHYISHILFTTLFIITVVQYVEPAIQFLNKNVAYICHTRGPHIHARKHMYWERHTCRGHTTPRTQAHTAPLEGQVRIPCSMPQLACTSPASGSWTPPGTWSCTLNISVAHWNTMYTPSLDTVVFLIPVSSLYIWKKTTTVNYVYKAM